MKPSMVKSLQELITRQRLCPFAPDRLCVNNQRNRQKIDHDRSFDTNAARQLPRHLTQYSEQSRKRPVILPIHV